MTALQLRANLFEEIIRNAENEEILQKVLDFFRSLTQKKTDPTEMTKEEFFAKLEKSREQAARGEVYSKRDDESFDDFFKRMSKEKCIK
jgi:lipoate-protein ligase A